MDSSLLVPQLVGIAFLAVAVGYVQVVLNPTARVKFDARDEDKRAYVKELMASEDEPGDDRGLERWYYRNVLLRGGMRPRGDQTRGGTVVPGLEQRKRREGGRDGRRMKRCETRARGDADAGGGGAMSRGSMLEDTKHPARAERGFWGG